MARAAKPNLTHPHFQHNLSHCRVSCVRHAIQVVSHPTLAPRQSVHIHLHRRGQLRPIRSCHPPEASLRACKRMRIHSVHARRRSGCHCLRLVRLIPRSKHQLGHLANRQKTLRDELGRRPVAIRPKIISHILHAVTRCASR